MPTFPGFLRCAVALVGLAVAGCGQPAPPAWTGTAYAPASPGGSAPEPAALVALGRSLFFEPTLSASGRTACASCHDPQAGYGPANPLAVRLAGRDGATPGRRAAPSLRYLQTLPPFTEHHFEDDGDDSFDAGPTGGHTWDGRAGSAHEQARLPLVSADEMGNASPAEVVERLQRGPLAEAMRSTWGAGIFATPGRAFDGLVLALEAFQQQPREFYPYTSRYDAVLRGQATLTPGEARGLRLFDDPAKGNCAACHPSVPAAGGAFPLFTDFGYAALGVPRREGAAASDADLGLCGPVRTDLADHAEYCGLFRVPGLRNTAVRGSYFHNGAFSNLRDVLRFYARRESEPERFFPRGPAGIERYGDLPPRHHGNVNVEPPFDRRPGDPPALDDAEIEDVLAFLATLTDADLVDRIPAVNRPRPGAASSTGAPAGGAAGSAAPAPAALSSSRGTRGRAGAG